MTGVSKPCTVVAMAHKLLLKEIFMNHQLGKRLIFKYLKNSKKSNNIKSLTKMRSSKYTFQRKTYNVHIDRQVKTLFIITITREKQIK